jgi:hypothetical protein
VADLVVLEELVEATAVLVDERVVGHDGLGSADPEFGEERQGALERVGVGVAVLAGMELDVGDPAVIVDQAVEVVVAGATVTACAVAGDPMAGSAEAGELLHVHVQQRTWP